MLDKSKMVKKVSFCNVCSNWFQDIPSHMRIKHPQHNEQKIGCNICDNNSVFTISALQQHKQMVHNIVSMEKNEAKSLHDPLHSAAKTGQSQKKNIHPENQNGDTLHQSAAKIGHLDVCKSSAQNKESLIIVTNVPENNPEKYGFRHKTKQHGQRQLK